MVTQLASRKILGINQRAYQCLKLSLSLNLRRQILIAVCDDIVLQNQLAAQLAADVGQPDTLTQSMLSDQPLSLARLTLDPGQTDFVAQVAQWLQQQPAGPIPCLQVLGIEQMTRQSLMAQHHFLQSLEAVESLLPHLNTSLLLWLPWPWLRAIQQSAPQFWRWRSGVFEFVGEPTPVVAIPQGWSDGPEDQPVVNQVVSTSSLYGESVRVVSAPVEPEPGAAVAPVDLWTLLSEDLAQLEAAEAETAASAHGDLASEDLSGPDAAAIAPPIDALLSSQPDDAQRDAVQPNAVQSNAVYTDATQAAETGLLETELLDTERPELQSNLDPVAQSATNTTVNLAALEAAAQEAETQATGPVIDFSHVSQPFEALAELKRQQRPPSEIAQAYLTLGHHYRSQIEAGAMTPELITGSIEAYEEGLRWLEEHDPNWASGLNDLGTLYWIQSQQHPDREVQLAGMARSLAAYDSGLAKIDQQHQAEVASRLHSNIGAVHSALASYQEPVTHLQQSVDAYRRALPLCAVEQHPEEYATLQNSLGSVYWKLSHYQATKQASTCLHRAIAAYNEALKTRRPQQAPLDYASVQNNLGIAYWSLSKYERPVFLLKHAIAAYRDALNYRTPHTDPGACANTYNNLGTAYWDIANHLEAEPDPQNRYRQNAIIAYEAALKAAQQGPSGLDLRSIHHCLGNVYDQMAQKSAAEAYLPKALTHYLAALADLERTHPIYEPVFKSLVRNLRSHYEQLGLPGQQAALGQLPGILLPEVMQAI